MVTKTILATAARLKSSVSTTKKAHSSAPTIAAQSNNNTVTILHPPAASATLQHQRSTCSQASRISSTPPPPAPLTRTTIPQTRSCSTSTPTQTPVGSTAILQTQSCSSSLVSTSLQPPTKSPRNQSGPPTPASASPRLPNANTPSLQAHSVSSTSASTPPHTPNASTVSPQTQPCISNPGTATPQPPTASIQTQSCLPKSATTSNQMPTPSTVSSQGQSCSPIPTSATTQLQTPTQSSPLSPASSPSQLSAPTSASRNAAPRLTTKLGKWTSSAIGLAAMVATVYYGSTTLDYARWTKHNDFQEGCINDRDHNLPLSAECVTELMLPRASAVKRHIEAVQDAYVANALYWTIAVCVPVLTCIFYLVWMRIFVRNWPKPVVSLARIDLSNCVQGYHWSGSAMIAENDHDPSGLCQVQDDKVYDHLQQAQKDSPPSDFGSEEDYFQAWKDGMKSHQADLEASDSDTGRILQEPRPRHSGSFQSANNFLHDHQLGEIIRSSISGFEDAENEVAIDLRRVRNKLGHFWDMELQGLRRQNHPTKTVRSRVPAVGQSR